MGPPLGRRIREARLHRVRVGVGNGCKWRIGAAAPVDRESEGRGGWDGRALVQVAAGAPRATGHLPA